MPQNILVTGGCGYLGSQLIRDLSAPNLNIGTIRILDNLQQSSLNSLMGLPDRVVYQFIEGDILDSVQLRRALTDIDIVIHLAAIVRTPLSFENPIWMEQVNHWGTAHLVEACLEAGVERLLFASSAAIYGPGGPHRETDLCRPQGPYAQSKLAAETVVRAAATRGLNTTVLRLGTLFGTAPVIRFDAVANRLAFLAGIKRRLTIYGSGEQKRSLVHVRDAASAIVLLCSQTTPKSAVFNVVAQNPSINELAGIIRQIVPSIAVHYTEQDIRTHFSFETESQLLQNSGWVPQETIEGGLAEIIHHFEAIQPFILR